MPTKVDELRGRADAKRQELRGIFEEAGDDLDMSKVKSIDGDSTAKVAHIKAINDELDSIASELEPLEEQEATIHRAKREADRLSEVKGHPGHQEQDRDRDRGREREAKSVGQQFVEAKAGTDRKGDTVELPDVEVKTLFETGAGWAPESTRSDRVVLSAERPPQVIDLLPSIPVSQASYKYMEETTFTNNAAEVAEGGSYGEAALALTERTEPIEKVGVWLPVTDEQLEDEPQAEAYINGRLPFMLRQRADGQVIVGNGMSPNLSGFLDRTGIGTQAKGADSIPDAVYKGMTKVRVAGRAIPGAVFFHPNNWQSVRLLTTSDGVYIFGPPSQPGPDRIWGVTVVQTDGITENTALVGDFANHTAVLERRGIEVKVRDTHDDYFVKGKQAVRADVRMGLAVFRPPALCEITGLDA